MFENIKNNDLLVIVLIILVLHVGYSMYTYCTKPKIQEGFCSKGGQCNQDSDCCSGNCELPYRCKSGTSNCWFGPPGYCKKILITVNLTHIFWFDRFLIFFVIINATIQNLDRVD